MQKVIKRNWLGREDTLMSLTNNDTLSSLSNDNTLNDNTLISLTAKIH